MKKRIKQFLYYTGILSAFHRIRNKHTLTIIMLHRVLPNVQKTTQGATPEWVLSDEVFSDFLQFVKKEYNIISYSQLVKADGDMKKLPKRALLLTFDDGWKDNYDYAFPILSKANVSAHIFLATDAIGYQHAFWQEQILAACRITPNLLPKLLSQFQTVNCTTVEHFVEYLQNHKQPNFIADLLDYIAEYQPVERQMLNQFEIKQMSSEGITFGGHGASHTPLKNLHMRDVDFELERCQNSSNELFDYQFNNLSFPHGSYDDEIVKLCIGKGFTFLFTSQDGLLVSETGLMPRVHIAEHAIAVNGIFKPWFAAMNLFFRDKL